MPTNTLANPADDRKQPMAIKNNLKNFFTGSPAPALDFPFLRGHAPRPLVRVVSNSGKVTWLCPHDITVIRDNDEYMAKQYGATSIMGPPGGTVTVAESADEIHRRLIAPPTPAPVRAGSTTKLVARIAVYAIFWALLLPVTVLSFLVHLVVNAWAGGKHDAKNLVDWIWGDR